MCLCIFFGVASLALGQSYDSPSAGEATLKNIDKFNLCQIKAKCDELLAYFLGWFCIP